MIGVTGANGLLGSFIVRNLLAEGKEFIAFKREDSDVSLLADVADKITWRSLDLNDELSVLEALKDISTVIHTAAVVSFNPKDSKKMFNCNVTGTRYIVNSCITHGVKRLIHISSVAALGRQKGQTLIDETNKWVTEGDNTAYAESKYLGELEVYRGMEEGVAVAIVNPSVILAPADWEKSSAKLFKYVWNQGKFYTDGCLNYVDVRDVARIACKLIEDESNGQRYIVNGGSISFLDFFSKMARHFQKKAPSIKLGRTLLIWLARLERCRSWVTGNDPLITRETARMAGTNFFYNNQKVIKALRVDFQSIDETLQWCCEYYIAKKQAKN
jgi:dihydroflavonol-4-reductase